MALLGILPQLAVAQTVSIQAATLGQSHKTAEVSTEELRRILSDASATVLDARPFKEFAAGHIPGARNVSAKAGVSMSLYVSDVAEIDRVMNGRKDAPIILYCNGPFCGKSSRLADELLHSGFTDVRRYQLGAPVWRALGGVMQMEPEGFDRVWKDDRTARIYDTRTSAEYGAGTLPGAIHLPKEEVEKAKDDGRLPMDDHNTRMVVFGSTAAEARATAEALAKNAFDNVMFCVDVFCRQQIASR
jgi:rhodanese-related sulfurtransferase